MTIAFTSIFFELWPIAHEGDDSVSVVDAPWPCVHAALVSPVKHLSKFCSATPPEEKSAYEHRAAVHDMRMLSWLS